MKKRERREKSNMESHEKSIKLIQLYPKRKTSSLPMLMPPSKSSFSSSSSLSSSHSSSQSPSPLLPSPIHPALTAATASASCIRSFVHWSIKKIFRMIPSIFLMLFILSLLFVTLMQVVVIHSDRKILLTYTWRTGVSSFSSSIMSNVTTSSSILKQMLTGLNYPNGDQRTSPRDPKGNITRTGSGTGTSGSSSSSKESISSAANSVKKKKKSDFLRIEALLDKSLPSRDVNVKVLQNFANSARIKEIIHLLQNKGALDSSPDSRRHFVTWNLRHGNQSMDGAHSASVSQISKSGKGITKVMPGREQAEHGSDPNAFPSQDPDLRASSSSSAGAMHRLVTAGWSSSATAADADGDQENSLFSLTHQEGSSRRSPGAAGAILESREEAAAATLKQQQRRQLQQEHQHQTSAGNFDHEDDEMGRKERRKNEKEQGTNPGMEQGNQSKLQGISLSSSSFSSTVISSSSQSNQEIDSPAAEQDGSGNLPEASVIVNSGAPLQSAAAPDGKRSGDRLVLLHPNPHAPSPSSYSHSAHPHAHMGTSGESQRKSFHSHDPAADDVAGKDVNPDRDDRSRELNQVNVMREREKGGSSNPAPQSTSNASLIVQNRPAASAATHEPSMSLIHVRKEQGSLFQQLMRDPNNKTVCSLPPPDLIGKVDIDMDPVIGENMSEIIRRNPNIDPGGHHAPTTCYPRHVVAIIIPYRDRWEHLSILLYHLHPILQRQQIEYKIYVAEQVGNETFNKGVLMNAGVREALREADYHCFIFHDVDLIPENDRNLYTCPISPRHMSYAVNKFNYTLPYNYLVGGVFAISKENLIQVNGYSNLYWGWGGEDDDMSHRLKLQNLQIIRPPAAIGRYTMIKHDHRTESPSSVRQALLRMAKRRASRDGLSSVRYILRSKVHYPLFTHLMIEIGHIHKWHFPAPNKLVLHF